MDLKTLLLNPEIIDGLLHDLDREARNVSQSEYGLPLYCQHDALFRQIVLQWFAKLDEQ